MRKIAPRAHTLVIDIGGTNIKIRLSGRRTVLKIPSGPTLTPSAMARLVRQAVEGWTFSRVSIGYPGVVRRGKPVMEPKNLGRGWVRFDFTRAFACPVKVINDAAMQALGSYRGGRMLFLGLGTGLGTAFIVDGMLAPMELAHLPYKKGRTYEEYIGTASLKHLGLKRWQDHVLEVTRLFRLAVGADEVVLGGGNAKKLETLPKGVRLGSNTQAFIGGVRLWKGGRR